MFIQYSKWIAIPLVVRAKIAKEFGIAKVRSTSVINNVVADDGYDVHAVEGALSRDVLQKYLDTPETDMNVLLEMLVVRTEAPQPIVEVASTTHEDIIPLGSIEKVKPTKVKKVVKKK